MESVRCPQSGITLAELLVAMIISAIIAAAAYALFRTHHLIALRQKETTLMQQELLAATTQIADELRMCGYSPSSAPGFGFAHRPGEGIPDYGRITNESGVFCTLDRNMNGVLDESGIGSAGDHAGFRLNVRDNGSTRIPSDNILRRFDTGSVKWQPLCTNIGNLRFAYRDASGAVIFDPENRPAAIRMVEIHVTAIPSANRAHLGITNRTMTTAVWCRNPPTHTDAP